MGIMDNIKSKLGPAKGKMADLAQQHSGKIDQGLDRAAKMADQRTKGKYSDKIQNGRGKARDAMDKLANSKDNGTGGTPGGSQPPAGH